MQAHARCAGTDCRICAPSRTRGRSHLRRPQSKAKPARPVRSSQASDGFGCQSQPCRNKQMVRSAAGQRAVMRGNIQKLAPKKGHHPVECQQRVSQGKLGRDCPVVNCSPRVISETFLPRHSFKTPIGEIGRASRLPSLSNKTRACAARNPGNSPGSAFTTRRGSPSISIYVTSASRGSNPGEISWCTSCISALRTISRLPCQPHTSPIPSKGTAINPKSRRILSSSSSPVRVPYQVSASCNARVSAPISEITVMVRARSRRRSVPMPL